MAPAPRRANSVQHDTATIAALLRRFSTDISRLVDEVIGTSSNHEVQVVVHLYRHPRQRPRDLMAVTGLTRPSVATLVGRLERLGLVERTFGEQDRRTTLASLTARGRRRMLQLDGALEEFFRASRAQMVELLELCGGAPADSPSTRPADLTGLSLVGEMGAVGARMVEAQGDGSTLHPRQLHAVILLHAWGPSRPGELAEALGLSSGGLTYLMDQMVADGLVLRTHGHPDDRRAVVIELSERGQRLGRESAEGIAANVEELRRFLALALAPVAAPPV